VCKKQSARTHAGAIPLGYQGSYVGLARTVYLCTVYDRMYGDFPAKITVCTLYIRRVGQNRIYTPYMTICMVISLLKIPYVHCIYVGLARTVYAHRI
jgi:hypothetical protein